MIGKNIKNHRKFHADKQDLMSLSFFKISD